jgi:hypothetical protein
MIDCFDFQAHGETTTSHHQARRSSLRPRLSDSARFGARGRNKDCIRCCITDATLHDSGHRDRLLGPENDEDMRSAAHYFKLAVDQLNNTPSVG